MTLTPTLIKRPPTLASCVPKILGSNIFPFNYTMNDVVLVQAKVYVIFLIDFYLCWCSCNLFNHQKNWKKRSIAKAKKMVFIYKYWKLIKSKLQNRGQFVIYLQFSLFKEVGEMREGKIGRNMVLKRDLHLQIRSVLRIYLILLISPTYWHRFFIPYKCVIYYSINNNANGLYIFESIMFNFSSGVHIFCIYRLLHRKVGFT